MRRPSRLFARVAQRDPRLEITVLFLGGQDQRDPLVQFLAERRLGILNLPVAVGIPGESDAHRLNRVQHPGVGEGITDVGPAGTARILLPRLDEILNSAFAKIWAIDLSHAMWDPVDNQCLGSRFPKRTCQYVVTREDLALSRQRF